MKHFASTFLRILVGLPPKVTYMAGVDVIRYLREIGYVPTICIPGIDDGKIRDLKIKSSTITDGRIKPNDFDADGYLRLTHPVLRSGDEA
jgi:hypothetical protein